jgi:hypothetical protein
MLAPVQRGGITILEPVILCVPRQMNSETNQTKEFVRVAMNLARLAWKLLLNVLVAAHQDTLFWAHAKWLVLSQYGATIQQESVHLAARIITNTVILQIIEYVRHAVLIVQLVLEQL